MVLSETHLHACRDFDVSIAIDGLHLKPRFNNVAVLNVPPKCTLDIYINMNMFDMYHIYLYI